MQHQQINVTRSGRVFLSLPGKEYKSHRCLGQIVGDQFHCERNPERHLFRQFGGSYGFNFQLMRDGSFSIIIVHVSLGVELITTRLHLLKVGKFLNFQRNQLERQIFLSLDEFGLDRATESETKPTIPRRQHDEQLCFFGGVQ